MKNSRFGFFFSLLALALAFSLASARGDCSLTTTGNVPLPDLGPKTYKGFVGGLYPGGTNTRPAAHEAAGLAAAAQIQPLDKNGAPDPRGTIVLTSIGMSSVTQEWNIDGPTSFMPRANADPSKSDKVTLVDGAQSGKDAVIWADPNSEVWTVFAQRLQSAGVSREQVQVAWFEEAIAYPENLAPFPANAQLLQSYLESILRNLKAFCPNLRVVYMSCRDRSYTTDPTVNNPEPYAYENGFSVQWTIADQINGTGNLNFQPGKGPVVAPYVTWGPYLWADGTNPRSDGFIWLCQDFEQDFFVHPSASGSGKVADQLLAFFKTDPTARTWFLKPSVQVPVLSAGAAPASGLPGTSFQFSSTVTDAASSVVSYQWTFDDGTFATVRNPMKFYPSPGEYNAHLTVTDALGNTSTTTVHVTVGGVTSSVGPLENVSTRGEVGVGDSVLIGGFIVNGSGKKPVLLRAIGPSLTDAGVTSALPDPTLELHDASGAIIATNDNWQTTQIGGIITQDQATAIRDTNAAPTHPKEAAIIANLDPGTYTAVVHGVNGASGVGLAEVYDLDPAAAAKLANISTRGTVATGDDILIGGFIVGAPDFSRVLVRALGPSLVHEGISNPLSNPYLELHDSNGNLLQANNDWADSQSAEIQATKIAPTDPRESAILQVLGPGSYTATVSGVNGATGIGLVEVYKLP